VDAANPRASTIRRAGYSGEAEPKAISNAKFYSRSHNAVIRVFDESGALIKMHEHAGDFREP
jgi:hypothetical protein